MHEHSLAKDMIGRALREVEGQERVAALNVVIGEDEHIAAEALSLAVVGASVNTAAEGTAIHIRRIPGQGVVLESVEVWEGAKCALQRQGA